MLGFEWCLRPLAFVHVEWMGRRAVDHGAAGDVEPGAVALAHDRRLREQASGERACVAGHVISPFRT